jgi:hypothetical protein
VDFGGAFFAEGAMNITQSNQYGKYVAGGAIGGPFPVACATE